MKFTSVYSVPCLGFVAESDERRHRTARKVNPHLLAQIRIQRRRHCSRRRSDVGQRAKLCARRGWRVVDLQIGCVSGRRRGCARLFALLCALFLNFRGGAGVLPYSCRRFQLKCQFVSVIRKLRCKDFTFPLFYSKCLLFSQKALKSEGN